MENKFVAHHRCHDDALQTVCEHLEGVSAISKTFAAKIGLDEAGALLGLLHDLGKYSQAFQSYIKSGIGLLNFDIDDSYVNVKAFKGKIDHSTAGAQWVWQRFEKYGLQGQLVGQILAVCLASHHGGMINCLDINGTNTFLKRIKKDDESTHLKECLEMGDSGIVNKLNDIATEDFLKYFLNKAVEIVSPQKKNTTV